MQGNCPKVLPTLARETHKNAENAITAAVADCTSQDSGAQQLVNLSLIVNLSLLAGEAIAFWQLTQEAAKATMAGMLQVTGVMYRLKLMWTSKCTSKSQDTCLHLKTHIYAVLAACNGSP